MLMTKKRSRPRDAGARQVAALHDDRGVERRRRRWSAISMSGTPGNGMSGGGAGSALTTRDLLAERAQRVGHRQLRADRVAVGPRVRGDARTAGARGSRRRSAAARRSFVIGSSLIVRVGAGSACESRSAAARCDPGRRSTRRRRTSAPARASAAAATPIWRRRNGAARSSALALALRGLVVAERGVDRRAPAADPG